MISLSTSVTGVVFCLSVRKEWSFIMGFKSDFSKAFRDLSGNAPEEPIRVEPVAPIQPAAVTQPVTPIQSAAPSFPVEPSLPVSAKMEEPKLQDLEVESSTIKNMAGEYSMNSPVQSQNPAAQIADYNSTQVPAPPMGGQYSAEPTVVSMNTVIKGDVITKDPLTVYGEVTGSVQCDNYLSVSGKIHGNTKGDKIVLNKASIEGDVLCNNDFFVGEGTDIVGNVSAQSANIHGSVQGSITVKDDVIIGPTAVVNGDITTESIEIKKGAFIKGQIIMQATAAGGRPAVAAPPKAVSPAAIPPRPAGISGNTAAPMAQSAPPPVSAANAPRSSAAAAAVQAAMQSVSAAARASQPKGDE